MSFLSDDWNGGFGHPAGPEWEGSGPPPLCPMCGEYHEPTDVCPLEQAHDDPPMPEEPAWCEEHAEEPGWGTTPLPGPPPVPSEIDLPLIVPDEPIAYEKPSYRYSSVMYRSEN